MKCFYCGNKYRAYKEDAGTIKEHFCSEECYTRYELEQQEFERDTDLLDDEKKE